MTPPTITPRYLSLSLAAIYLGMTEASLQYKIKERMLPFIKIGKTVRLDTVALDKRMAGYTIPAKDPMIIAPGEQS